MGLRELRIVEDDAREWRTIMAKYLFVDRILMRGGVIIAVLFIVAITGCLMKGLPENVLTFVALGASGTLLCLLTASAGWSRNAYKKLWPLMPWSYQNEGVNPLRVFVTDITPRHGSQEYVLRSYEPNLASI